MRKHGCRECGFRHNFEVEKIGILNCIQHGFNGKYILSCPVQNLKPLSNKILKKNHFRVHPWIELDIVILMKLYTFYWRKKIVLYNKKHKQIRLLSGKENWSCLVFCLKAYWNWRKINIWKNVLSADHLSEGFPKSVSIQSYWLCVINLIWLLSKYWL